jgi:polar amino acid transport system substrate-binding protein
MNKRFVAVIVSAMAAVLLVALCGCTGPYDPNASMKESTVEPEALHQPGTLRVGVDAASYPFAGQANGEITGLDVDVASALAQEMGLKVEFVDVGSEPGEALSAAERQDSFHEMMEIALKTAVRAAI